MQTKYIFLSKLSFLFISVSIISGCTSLMPKPYQASSNARTAELTYQIEPSTFFSPKPWITSGYKERVDVQLLESIVTGPKTIYMQFADHVGSRNIYTVEADKPLRLIYEHKMVQGLGNWPMMCATMPVKVTFKPNHHYIFKAGTKVTYRPSKLLNNVQTHDASCHVQIIDSQTNEVIASTVRDKFI